ncbi:non-ribosomal peptide synthetase [Roseospira visakhapatnamensis]|uniref:Amino acid adenylation domain-containing protein n=1 Tax=Roseospira visakhapatnamensis TaxID=390880 RepID=A0A7W6RFC0_9PROT|nr:non-ribosomal peptide synthetase [Roseospira visakhapatnamensis]MBB4266984.1 amino acid adenylation domain-containing protein [Roseospira visakhapatnamensis]
MRDDTDLPLYPTGPMIAFDPLADGEIKAAVPTIAAQREIWTSLAFGPDAHAAYNNTVSLWFENPVEVDHLTTALRRLVARHPLLRAGFSADGHWLSVFASGTPDITVADLRPLGADALTTALDDIVTRNVTEPFDLSRPTGLRATVARLPGRRTRVTLTVSHILCDGLSWDVLLNDLGAVLDGTAGEPDDPVLDFMEQALAQEDADAFAADLDYWRDVLADGGPDWSLPLDHDPAPGRHFASHRVDDVLAADLVGRIKALGIAHGMTFHTMILSAVTALLHRLSGADDLVVGIPVAGQAISGHPTMIGHGVHLLPVRSRLTRDLPLLDLAGELRETVLDAREHHAVDFGLLLENLPVRRSPGRVPLVPVLINIDGTMGPTHMGGQAVRLVDEARRFENFELFLDMLDAADGLHLRWNASSVLFERETIARFNRSLEVILRAMVEAPDTRVSRLPLISAEDLARLDRFGHGPPAPPPTTGRETVPAAIWAAATAWGDRPAVHDDRGATLTYREVLNRAERVAAALAMAGAGPGDRVAIHLDRHADLVTALLGVLRAGCCLLFLDPGQPQGRRREVLADAAPAVLLVEAEDGEAVARLAPAASRVLTLPEALLTEGPLPSPPTPDTLSHHYYTSGSTGTPKGIPLTHRALMLFMAGTAQVMEAHAGMVWMTQASVVFDVVLQDCLIPLMHGGRVVVAGTETRRDPLALAALADREGVTHWQATPTSWRMLVGLGWEGNARLSLISGGEPLPRALADALLDRVAALWNFYGPTETTVYATAGRVARDEPVTVGVPLPGYEIRVVDRAGERVPPGAVGEILIAGTPVAAGYHDRPDQTAKAFFSDPDGRRVYRTGDLGRWGADGRLHHRGRADAQIKLHGHRIELEEIEARLMHLDGITQAGVVLADAGTPRAHLIAALVTAPGRGPVTEEMVRARLLVDLPEAMIPKGIHCLDRLPQTATGKLDRKALLATLREVPAPATQTAPPAAPPAEGAPPSTMPAAVPTPAASPAMPPAPAEIRGRPAPKALPAHLARMVDLWEEVLARRDIGVDASFFALGGTSLDAATLAVEIGAVYGSQPTLGDVFAHDTPRTLATLMAARIRPSGIARATCLATGRPDLPPIILFPPQGGQILRYRKLAITPGLEAPLWAFEQSVDLLDRTSMGDIVEAFLPDVAAISGDHPLLLGGFSFGGALAYEAAQRLTARGQPVAGLILLDTVLDLPESLWFKLHRAWLEARFADDRLTWFRDKVRRNALKLIGRYVPPPLFEPEMADLPGYRDLMAIHTNALHGYRPAPTTVPVTLIASDGDPVACRLDPNNGWLPFAKGPFTRIGLPFEDHLELLENTHLPAVVATLTRVAEAVRDATDARAG